MFGFKCVDFTVFTLSLLFFVLFYGASVSIFKKAIVALGMCVSRKDFGGRNLEFLASGASLWLKVDLVKKKCCIGKGGFTLMELMVYIAVLGVVVLVAGQAFSNSTKFRVRTSNMIKAADISERTAAMFLEDVSQMGAKSYKEAGDASNPDRIGRANAVYMAPSGSPADSSSFTLTKNADGDNLVTNRVRFDENGYFESVEQVNWFKRGDVLYRTCKTVQLASGATAPEDCPSENSPEVVIADHVQTFEVIPAQPNIVGDASESAEEKSVVLPELTFGTTLREFRLVPRFNMASVGSDAEFIPLSFVPSDGGTSQELSGFVANYDMEAHAPITDGRKAHQVFVAKANTGILVADGNYWKTLCSKVTLDSATEYEISFRIPYSEDDSRLFCPGRDHAAVGFRDLDGNVVEGLNDFLFYAPSTKNEPQRRSFRFSVGHTIKDVCMAFTFSSYSPTTTGGKVTINELVLRKVASSNYNFIDETYNPETADKQNVKAFKLHLVVNRGDETSEISQVVPTPSNGPRD